MSAPLEWQNGQPFSAVYGDIYFSRESGIDEARQVFLVQNNLFERWTQLEGPGYFVIGETGFGTGLNFLCAWKLWLETAPKNARLCFISTELYPLSPGQLAQALEMWPELAGLCAELMGQYADLSTGWHRLVFSGGRVLLTLLVGDANETLKQLTAKVDAWFLDGFAPARNPELWSEGVFNEIARCSMTGTTFATYTCAGFVRRGLRAAGFNVQKIPGHGSKREMLRGALVGHAPAVVNTKDRDAIVIGGGLAGSATAYSLAQRGWRVTLLERHSAVASEASGNHQGILYARISPKKNLLSEFALAGYQFAIRNLALLLSQGENRWNQCGLLQLAFDDDEAARLRGVASLGLPSGLLNLVDRVEASRLAGIEVPYGGIFFPGGGWVHPPALCRAMLEWPGIDVKTETEVIRLEKDGDAWRAFYRENEYMQVPVVIVACAAHSMRFEQTAHLPLRSIRGQVTHLGATPESMKLRMVLCGEGYAAPVSQQVHTVGATYGNLEEALDLRAVDHQENLSMLARMSPALYFALGGEEISPDYLDGRAACRCNVPDYFPLVGEVSQRWPGLFVNTGHGSRGLITAMLSAEVLASILEGEPSPVPEDLLRAMSPQRFRNKPKC